MEFLNHLFEDRINEKMCGIYCIALLIALIRVQLYSAANTQTCTSIIYGVAVELYTRRYIIKI